MACIVTECCETLRNVACADQTILKLCFDKLIEEKLSIHDQSEILSALANVKFGVFGHELFSTFHDTYTNLLQKWNKGETLSNLESSIFKQIGALFTKLADEVTAIETLQQLLLNKPLMESMEICMQNVEYILQDGNLTAVSCMIHALRKIQTSRTEMQDDSSLLRLLDPILNCICSSYYMNVVKDFRSNSEILCVDQEFLLIACPHYIHYYWGKRREEAAQKLCDKMFNFYVETLERLVPDISEWNEPIIRCLRHIIALMCYIDTNEIKVEHYELHIKTIDLMLRILTSADNLLEKTEETNFLVYYCIGYLYSLTFVPTLLNVIEQKSLKQILLRYINVKHAEHVQFNAYRILAVLMNEDDIKTLTKPREITALFKSFLEKLIDDPYRQLRLRNTLVCLKTLVQHDEIKHEMVEQDVLPLLIRCATEPKFDVVQRQKHSLGLLWAMTFNEEATIILKEDQKFMVHVKSLLRSVEQDLRKVADGIVWKLDKEAQFMAKQEHNQSAIQVLASPSYKYDIMISYSHNDKDLCCQIRDKLIADGYRVWFDRDHLSGSIMQAMADAIENSYLVLI
ncbi:unnamed protein product, partial [Didymodactylos carnosus]